MKTVGLTIVTAAMLASAADTVPLNQQQARISPEWITHGVMYQIQPRAFTPEGTLKAAQARLLKLAELGVTVLYLCPIFVSDDDMDRAGWSPRQKKSGMNNPRNPYRMKDFYHVDPEYGTDADLKAFVQAAHQLKLRVMLDMVYLHCGPKAVFLEKHPDFVMRDKDGKMVLKAWNFPGLNLANPELREYLWKNMEWWVRDFGVDGFRCDVADGIPLDFWETARERLEKLRPDVGMLAEGTRKADQLKAFDLDYGWDKAFKDFNDAAAIRKSWETMRKERPIGGAKFVRFIDNHDFSNDDYENRLEKRWGNAKVNTTLVALFTLDGVPFLYNGQEVADTARHSIYARLPINWANGETAAGKARFAFCQKLCALRRSEPALNQGDLVWLANDAPTAAVSFLRASGRDRILTVLNLTSKPVSVKLAGLADTFKPLLAEGAKSDGQGGFALEAHGYFVGNSKQPGATSLKSPTKARPLVGAIRWDAWYGPLPALARPPVSVEFPGFNTTRSRKVSQDPGKETRRALAAEQWRYRWPFFATLAPDGSAKDFNENKPDVIEREIEYAVHAGLSYWAFTAYPENCPLSYTLKTFLTCKSRDKLKFCLFLPMWPAYGRIPDDAAERAYWAHVLRMVHEPNYLKVEGNRPVFYLGFLNDQLAEKILSGPWPKLCAELAKCGFGKPWVAICHSPAKAAKRYCDMLQADALSQYGVPGSAKAGAFSELAARAEKFWEDCAATGANIAPICMAGWDRRPRVTNPVSWEDFHLKPNAFELYYKSGTPDEIAAHVGRGVSWFQKHPAKSGAELVLIYAWNEFDEGGWLAPALPPPHGEGMARVDALRKVLVTR